jgi:quercetin dioxygenase-like cupin family protein
MANETGLSTDYLKKIEAGGAIPPVGTLLQIARAMDIDSEFFLKEDDATQEKRQKAQTKRTDNYAYTTLTPGAENKHLKAFLVKIAAMQEHKGVGYQHDGEEFIYVLAGKIEIIVGDHVNTLKKGETLHFNSGVKHKIKNVSKKDAELVVVVYSP